MIPEGKLGDVSVGTEHRVSYAAQFCKAEGRFLGEGAFRQKYGGAANAHGKCVSQNHY
jgi:hypothetical protein